MINKEVLAQFIYKPTNQLKNCLPWKIWYFITLGMYIEEKGWLEAIKYFWPITDVLKNVG